MVLSGTKRQHHLLVPNPRSSWMLTRLNPLLEPHFCNIYPCVSVCVWEEGLGEREIYRDLDNAQLCSAVSCCNL
jgi:hypothetical protein